MARLDRLTTAKGIAQMGAVIGRHFSYALLQVITQRDEAALQRDLNRLVESELLYQRGLPPQVTYVFKHALITDAAYQSLLKSTRQHYHQRIAQALTKQFPEAAKTHPELVACHYTEAGLHLEAVGYWQRAGQRAVECSAYPEAIRHLRTGLEVLRALPDTAERSQHELALQVALGHVLIATQGYAAEDVERAHARARQLCQHVGNTPSLFSALVGLHAFYQTRGPLPTALQLAQQLLALAQQERDPALLVEAHVALGCTLSLQGELSVAEARFAQGLALYDPRAHAAHALHYGLDPRVSCLANASWNRWLLGYPTQALAHSHEALELAHGLSHPFSQAFAFNYAAGLAQYCGDVPAVAAHAESLRVLAEEEGFRHMEATARNMRGWALVVQGQATEGLTLMREALTERQATGAPARVRFLAMLAAAYGRADRIDEGLARLADARAWVEASGERDHAAEVHRLQGELLLKLSSTYHAQAAVCFHQALDIARHQQAKSLELRAVMSLARLWQSQGKRQEAYALLAPVYEWFTEGFDTSDLQDAQALLDELST